jgi:soluble lytic murein transglycosylase-like protein
MNLSQLRDLAASVGFPDPDLAAAVAMAESGGNPNAIGDVTLGRSVGLWQINLAAHPQYDEASLLDPTTNASAAFEISRGGTNWGPWTTYRTGAYEQYYSPSTTRASWLTTSRAVWISTGILAAGGLTFWWLSLSPREKRKIRRMLPA